MRRSSSTVCLARPRRRASARDILRPAPCAVRHGVVGLRPGVRGHARPSRCRTGFRPRASGGRLAWLSGPLKLVLVLTVLIVSGHFAAYTYVRPFLEQVSHASPALVSTALLLYGAAGVAGNFAAGAWAARNPKPVLLTLALLMALSTAALPLIGLPLIVLMVWGLGYGGAGVTLQLWIMRSGGGEMGTAPWSARPAPASRAEVERPVSSA
ncbi:MFS transporter [Sphaerisporangium sp. NPDC005289]|uniref:MFS transporter n=1 Tax=Sphaerisporangium sp. NPDC005289 TaxID=3155247 RepID=UPI0033B6A2B5